MACELCDGSLHVRTPCGWVRCSCLSPILDRAFIKAQLRLGVDKYPEAYDAMTPWPLADTTRGGHWNQFAPFKYMAWRSLTTYRDRNLKYDYIDAYRLVDVIFSRDILYTSLRQITELPLLVFVIGMADIPNKLTIPAIVQMLTLRKDMSLPTWTFVPFATSMVPRAFGVDVANILGPVLSVSENAEVPEVKGEEIETPAGAFKVQWVDSDEEERPKRKRDTRQRNAFKAGGRKPRAATE